IALGIAAGSTYLFGVSMALGAFLAGMVVGQSEFSARAGAEALPMRDAFAVLFFLSVGMLFDPVAALQSPLLILATLAVVVIGKPLAAMTIVALLGYSSRIGLGVSIALAQVGEFSFLLAVLGRQIGILPPEAMNPIVAASILSIMLNPMLFKALDSAEQFLVRYPWLWRMLNRRAAAAHAATSEQIGSGDPSHTAVVVGHGPIGQIVSQLLRSRGIEPTVIEMNIETVRLLNQSGTAAVYGDANQDEVLEKAGIHSAASFVLSASGAVALTEAIRKARDQNPEIHIVARADFLRDAEILTSAGAHEVFSGEGEVALAMTDSILRSLGSTPEQLDSERERIRQRFFRAGVGRA
ncbi:MAG TPA: cation:proton antiporter, partial [Bryobacteraceae bacterium]|nr:cation:proton antiporter [Bryobacteraceae bacterium]